MDVVRVRGGEASQVSQAIAAEIPFTIKTDTVEIATLLCSPLDLKELAYGYLYTSGFIGDASELRTISVDTQRWVATVSLAREPDPGILARRLYTSGCGKGVMYANVAEIASRKPLESSLRIKAAQIAEMATWLQHCSALYRETGAVHTAALSDGGAQPHMQADDVGRHNAVDKVIGRALLAGSDFARGVLISSGRTSSEILHKAKRAGIAIIISRGAPTHQTVLRARDMGVTVVGFARGGQCTVYSHEERVGI
jgi:FdhD protein